MSIAAQAKTKKKNRIHQSFGSRAFDVFNVIFMFLFLLVTLYPFWYVVIVSLSDGKAVLSGQVSLIPVNFTFDTYRVVLRDSNIVTGFKNTVIYTTLGTLINLVCTSLCAYPLSRPDLIGKKQMRGMNSEEGWRSDWKNMGAGARDAAKLNGMFFLVVKAAKMRENATCGEMKHAELGHEAPR